MSLHSFVHALADCFLAAEPALDALEQRARLLTVRPLPLVRSLAEQFLEKSSGSVRWRHSQLTAFLLAQPSLRRSAIAPVLRGSITIAIPSRAAVRVLFD